MAIINAIKIHTNFGKLKKIIKTLIFLLLKYDLLSSQITFVQSASEAEINNDMFLLAFSPRRSRRAL